MGAPTGTELSIYKSHIKKHDIRARIEVDYPVVSSNFTDTFATNGDLSSVGDYSKRWYTYKPDSSQMDVLGNLVIGVDTTAAPGGILRPATIWTKEGIVFPVDKTLSWTLEWSMRFNFTASPAVTTTYLPTAFKVGGIDNTIADAPDGTSSTFVYGVIAQIDGNQYLGTNAMIPEGTYVWNAPTSDTSFHTYKLEFGRVSAGTVYYDLYVDASLVGSLAAGIGGRVIRAADFIAIGAPGWGLLSSAIPAVWSQIEIQYVTITSGSTETVTLPSWYSNATNPWTAYDANDTNRFSWIPSSSIIGGTVSVDKDNQIDALQLTLATKDTTSTDRNIFRDFHFINRRIIVESRQSDGTNWTSWKQIFVGVVDDHEYSIEDQTGIKLDLRARDINRRKLQRTTLTRAYADFTTAVTGIPNSYLVSQILADIAEQAKLRVDPAYTTSAAYDIAIYGAYLKPKTLNIINEDGLTAMVDICDDIVYEIWVDHKNTLGKIYTLPFQYPDPYGGSGDYEFSVYDEVVLVNYAPSALSHVAQVELTIEGVNGAPFFAQYPAVRWPGDGSTQQRSSRIVQSLESLTQVYPFHQSAWRRENRNNGSIEITAVGQDWLEMNLTATCLDDIFLNIPVTIFGPFYIIDGWQYTWDQQKFMAKIRLVYWRNQDFERRFL